VEAMLRGVPVLASDVGGIPEAKMGVDYLLPVRPIEKYAARLDEQMVPVAEVPPQDVAPWRAALEALLGSRGEWERVACQSRAAALGYAANLNAVPFEALLERTLHEPRRERHAPAPLDKLSPEKRRLLELRLRKKTNPWFPSLEMPPGAARRLFCFPHAGGGTAMYARWAGRLPREVAVCPVRLPGREIRAAEAPFESMGALVEALGEAIMPYTGVPFAFFGHSMGAVVAFELARWLRRQSRQPLALIVSAARAPQFRRGHVPPPDPADEQFLAELRRLQGMPEEVLEREDLLAMVLPALRGDAALYRRYVYDEEAPLACPIHAFGGEADPNVTRRHLEAWAEQTTAGFSLRLLPGGHFYPPEAEGELLRALAALA